MAEGSPDIFPILKSGQDDSQANPQASCSSASVLVPAKPCSFSFSLSFLFRFLHIYFHLLEAEPLLSVLTLSSVPVTFLWEPRFPLLK